MAKQDEVIESWEELENIFLSIEVENWTINYDKEKDIFTVVVSMTDGRSQLVQIFDKEKEINFFSVIGSIKNKDMKAALHVLESFVLENSKAYGHLQFLCDENGNSYLLEREVMDASFSIVRLCAFVEIIAGTADALEEQFVGGDKN